MRATLTAGLVAAIVLCQASVGCAVHTTDTAYKPVPPAALVIRLSQGKVLPPSSGAYTGVFKYPAPFPPDALDTYTKLAGKKPAIVMWYQPWTGGFGEFHVDETKAVLKRGSIPMITWESWNPGGSPHWLTDPTDQPDYQLSKIAGGKYDSYIRSWARDIKTVNGPVMLRPMHEMNGRWYPWCGTVNGNTPADFRAAWRHIHDLFVDEGATNVTWVWSINRNSLPNTYANRFAAYYPGDAYVDWTSISGFNWGKRQGPSRSFDYLYTESLTYLRTVNKPIVISEIGCNTDGVDKPAWILDTYRQILLDHHEVKGIVIYDKREVGVNGTQNWQLNSSKSSAAAYHTAISSRMFIGGSSGSLLSSQSVTP
jgi:mannan endo-1,4-beta-mannosidase